MTVQRLWPLVDNLVRFLIFVDFHRSRPLAPMRALARSCLSTLLGNVGSRVNSAISNRP